MDRPDNGAPHPLDDPAGEQESTSDGLWRSEQERVDYEEGEDAEEVLGNDLAAYAFLREDEDREVRLYFRDAPVGELALAFRRAGGLLLSIAGERALIAAAPAATEDGVPVEARVEPHRHGRRGHRGGDKDAEGDGETGRSRRRGELTLRYFFAMEDIVYTLIITSSTGVIESISGIYPQAALSEQEVRARLAAIFT